MDMLLHLPSLSYNKFFNYYFFKILTEEGKKNALEARWRENKRLFMMLMCFFKKTNKKF